MIYSGYTGTNADLIAAVSQLYIKDDDIVADVTYGQGVFWKKTDTSRFNLLASDIGISDRSGDGSFRADFRALPYGDHCIDVVVFDPPYVHNAGAKRVIADKHYKNSETTEGLYNSDIMELYRLGMTEAARVISTSGGQMWVKCKDEVEANVQRWSHITIYNIAMSLGLCPRDLFVLMPSASIAPNRWGKQWHARKNHSFLWVFTRPDERYAKLLKQNIPTRMRNLG